MVSIGKEQFGDEAECHSDAYLTMRAWCQERSSFGMSGRPGDWSVITGTRKQNPHLNYWAYIWKEQSIVHPEWWHITCWISNAAYIPQHRCMYDLIRCTMDWPIKAEVHNSSECRWILPDGANLHVSHGAISCIWPKQRGHFQAERTDTIGTNL